MLTTQEKQNIAEGFTAAGERMNAFEEYQEESKAALEELKAAADQLAVQLKNYGKAVLSGVTQEGAEYRSFWPNEEMAKQFGELVLTAMRQKAMGEGEQTTGGLLVPEELKAWVIQKLGQYGKYRRDATVVPLGSDRAIVPKIESDLTIYCPGEGGTITDSDITFSQVGLTAKKLCCLAKASREVEEDSVIGLGEIVGISIARSMAKKEDLIGFMGDGTSTYFGMTGIVGALRGVDEVIANIKGLVVAAGNAYSEITLANFREVAGILPDDCDETAKWYMNKKFYYEVVYPLAEAAGVANIFEILSDRKGRFLLGYDVVFVSAMPSVEANSQICALLGDLQMGAYLGERRQMQIERSDHVHFSTDQVGFRGTERIDINAFGVGDTSEAGPIVGLITAAA